jgi:hypothetical protein
MYGKHRFLQKTAFFNPRGGFITNSYIVKLASRFSRNLYIIKREVSLNGSCCFQNRQMQGLQHVRQGMPEADSGS